MSRRPRPATSPPPSTPQRQPPPVPGRRVLGRGLRRRGPVPARLAVRRGAPPASARLPTTPPASERLSRHRSRRHRAHRHAPLRDGDRHPHVAADGRRRRARRRLDARQDRAGHRRRALRRPEHRRLEVDPRLLRRVPPGGRVGPRDADQAAAAQWHVPAARVPDRRCTRSCTRPADAGRLRLARRRRPPLPVPAAEHADPQAAQRVALHRQGSRPLRPRDIVHGTAVYGMDAKVDGMVYASIERPPVLGATLKSVDDKAALAVRASGRRGDARSAEAAASCSSRSAASP